MVTLLLSQLAEKLGARLELRGGVDALVSGITSLERADKTQVSFVNQDRYLPALATTQAAAVMLTEAHASQSPVPVLIMANPYLGFAKVATLFDPAPKAKPGVAASAVVDPTARIPASASIGARAVIGPHVVLGERTVIGPGSVVGDNAVLGDDTELKANVTIYHGVQIGKRCLFHSGAVIGSDGFGNVQEAGRWLKIPQLGTVIIDDDVEIGANTTVDRGALGNTHLHQGVKLDNLIQIAHNVEIGEHTAIAAQTGIAGSTKLGKHCMIGGAVAITGHIQLGDKIAVTAMSGISKSLDKPGIYAGSWPAKDHKVWAKRVAHVSRLDQYVKRIQALEQQVATLTSPSEREE